MKKTLILLWLGCMLGATQVSADTNAEEVTKLIQRGVDAFNLGQFLRSERSLLRALRRKPQTAQAANIQLHLGMIYVVLGRTSKAELAFREALEQDPLLILRPGETKKSILDMFQRIRATLKGELAVTADQEGAQLELDGAAVGPVPYKGKVTIGSHSVLISKPGGLFESFHTKVVVHVGKTQLVHARLRPHAGRVKLTSTPEGARVVVDGTELGQTPVELVLPTGAHEIRLEHQGHRSHTQKLQVAGGQTATVAVRLSPVVAAKPVPLPKQQSLTEKPQRRISNGRLTAWITAGAAVAAMGTGIGLGVWAQQTHSDFEDAAKEGDARRYDELKDSGPRRQLAANICFATAGALAVTATLFYFLSDSHAEPDRDLATAGRLPVLHLEF